MLTPTKDSLLQLTVLSQTQEPQRLIWQAMHQCYSPSVALDCPYDETEAGKLVVKHLLLGNRGHYSPLEQASLSCSVAFVPHSLMQQLTRHRHLSFSVQSFRYTSSQFIKYATEQPDVNPEALDALFHFRSPLYQDYELAHAACHSYKLDVECRGLLPEDARGRLPFNLRQHAVVGGNLRAWWHLLDVRLKPDTEPEFQQLMVQLQGVLGFWVPQLQEWYNDRRATKAVLSP
jgi:thymidylate synthase (FAD)